MASRPSPAQAPPCHIPCPGQLPGYERAQSEGECRPQLRESLGATWPAPTPAVHHRLAFISPESQGAGWQDLPQQPRRLIGGPAEAHVGVGPWGLQAHRDRGPQTQQQANRWEWVPVTALTAIASGSTLGRCSHLSYPLPHPSFSATSQSWRPALSPCEPQGYGKTSSPTFSGFAGLRWNLFCKLESTGDKDGIFTSTFTFKRKN